MELLLRIVRRSIRPNFSVHPVEKTMHWITKWMHLFDGRNELYHHAKFGEDRTMIAGCRCENVVFVYFLFVFLSRSESGVPCVRGVHISNKHCVANYRPILTMFSAFFSGGTALSDPLHCSHFYHQVEPQFSRNCHQKLQKVEKSAEKFVRTTSYR